MALANMSIASFKEAVGCQKIDILENPKTGKLFASGDNGKNWKVQSSIDFKTSIVVLVEDGDLESACFINPGAGAEVKITL